jgi:outer membrane protein assembly factor BamB
LSGAVIRARPDRLVSYDLATGRVHFTYTIADPQLLCAMSRTTGSGIGLIGYGPEGGRCEHIVALDLTSGRELWHRDLTGPTGLAAGGSNDFVAISGDLAVVGAPGIQGGSGRQGLQAFDLRTGAARWQAQLADRCSLEGMGGRSSGLVSAIVRCVQLPDVTGRVAGPVVPPGPVISYQVQAYDPVTGKQRWQLPLPFQAFNADVEALSYDPLIMHVRETATRGTDKFYLIDDTGQIVGDIDAGAGAAVTLDVSSSGAGSALQSSCSCVIGHGVLVVQARNTLGAGRSIQAYRLSDGRQVWTRSIGTQSLQAMSTDGDQVVLLTEQSFTETLTGYSLTDGTQHSGGSFHLDLLTAQVTLFARNGTYAILSQNGQVYPPVAVVH